MRMEINLIGRTVDEATEELEKYLDRAFMAGLPRVRVIHGHGAGILRRGVREFLKGHPHVAGLSKRLRKTKAGRGLRWWSCGSSRRQADLSTCAGPMPHGIFYCPPTAPMS